MSVARQGTVGPRQGTVGATRVCPHCKATVLDSANICPGCQHHLRFNAGSAEPQSAGYSALRVEGTFQHKGVDEQCEYCVVVSISNSKGERIARNIVGVGALQPGERHGYSFSVELIPPTRPALIAKPPSIDTNLPPNIKPPATDANIPPNTMAPGALPPLKPPPYTYTKPPRK